MAAILCIDYDYQFRRRITDLLSERGHRVVSCECPEQAFPILQGQNFHLIVSELYLPFSVQCDDVEKVRSFEVGVKMVRELSWALPDCKIVGLSAMSSANLLRIAKFLPTVPVVAKPLNYRACADLIESFLINNKVDSVH